MQTEGGFEAWEQLHRAQLDHYNVPAHLREPLYHKLANQIFDAADAFVFAMTEEEEPLFPAVLVANKDVAALSDIWLVDHCWVFEDKFAAWQQLLTIPAIQERMLRIIGIADASDMTAQEIAQAVVDKLLMCAFPMKLASGNTEQTLFYVMDEVGTWMTMTKEEPTMACVPFYEYTQGQTYSLIWPLEDIEEGETPTRAFLHGINVLEKGFEYWDSRFRFEDDFEWYSDFESLKQLIEPHVSKDARILVPGCGTSELSYDLVKEGYTSVLSCDYSPHAIETMQNKHPDMEWKVADCCNLDPVEWPDSTFDAIIDKGVLDAMLQKPISEQKSPEDTWKKLGVDDVSEGKAFLQQMARIAKDGAIFILLSLGTPENRLMLLEMCGWELVEQKFIPKEQLTNCKFPIYMYVCVHHRQSPAAQPSESSIADPGATAAEEEKGVEDTEN